jgi:serine/threonine-protein kinase
MAYCYECGSEVAPNDVFCPYCGISLQSMNAGGTDAEQNSSAEESFGVSADFGIKDNAKNEAISNPNPETINSGAENKKAGGEVSSVKTDDYSLSDTEENWSFKTDPSDLRINEPAGEAFENPEIPPTPSLLSNQKNYTETPGKPSANQETNIDDTVDEFSSTIPYMPPTVENRKGSAVKMAEEPQNEAQKNNPAKKSEESPTLPEAGIAKPSEELEVPELTPPSVFDSVRIMERSSSEEKAVKRVFESSPLEISQQRGSEENTLLGHPSPIKSHAKETHSHTTPNIGGSDTDGKNRAKLKPLDEGTILNGRYEIIRKIGGGGMGAVYLASDNNLGGVLRAVKEMVQSYIEETQQDKAINDFKRESMILSTLDHSSIPTIYDYFYDEKESRFYLVMKYISGGDLAARLRSAPEGRIDEKSVTEWAIQIADVLDYLHNRPTTIVYRDLKPSNVMIDGNSGRVMLIDFGIARSVNKEERGVTAVGTMGYAPPELFSGNVEPRSDIYSLGSTMFHLLTGADPQSNPLLIFDFQKNPRPRQINSSLSDQIEKIVMRAVEYNAQARFASAAEMRRVLEEHLQNLKTGRVTYGIKETPASLGLENQPVFCGFCGQRIMASDMFCAFCGSKQPLAQKGVQSQVYSRSPVTTAKLMIVGTNELDAPVFNLDKDENLVGRRDPMSNIFPEVDLSKFDPQTKISRRHARIWRDAGNYLVEDLGSSNGTVVMPVVNGTVRLLPHQPHVLANGDKIRLGDTTLHFVLG